jgi:hypothetical protein
MSDKTMKTTHEVLHDMNVARLRSEDEERKWTQLRRECQSPAVLGFTWLGILLVTFLIGVLWLRNHPGDWKGLPLALFSTVLVTAPGVLLAYQRKQKVLLKIIESEAPQLFQKLKTKGIT